MGSVGNDLVAKWDGRLAEIPASSMKPMADDINQALLRCGWKPIETAPDHGYIVVGTQIAKGKWVFNYVFREYDEWIDFSSDRVVKPHVWMVEPPEQPA